MKFLGRFIKNLPSLLTAAVFALAIWVFAVNQADPTETRIYPRALGLEIIGLNPNLMIVNEINEQVLMTIRAPSSILNQLENNINLINVTLDLSGLEPGIHTLTPQVNIGLSPAEVVRLNPSTVFVKLDSIVTASFPIQIDTIGNPAIGFDVQEPELSYENVLVSGPQSLIDYVVQVTGEVNIVDVSETIQRTIDLEAINAEGMKVEGVSLNPSSILVTIPVTQRGGYRTVVVKIVTSGQIATGHRLTNIFAMPPTVTIFSSDPTLVQNIPGFIETTPINLNGASENLDIRVALNLPEGINVVGSQNVTVQIGVEPIESSISFTNIPVQTEGLGANLDVIISPETVDVFLSGPLNVLDDLDLATLKVIIDLSGRGPGTYQLAPTVILENDEIDVDAILPSTLEVMIMEGGTRPSPTGTPTVTPTVMP